MKKYSEMTFNEFHNLFKGNKNYNNIEYYKKFYDELIEGEKEGRINYPETVKDYLNLIIDIGYDYDGNRTVEGLKGLIGELVEYAGEALKLIK